MSIDDIFKLDDKNELLIQLYDFVSNECEYGDKMDHLTNAEQVFYLCQTFEMEVNNGGINQFFYNSSGNHTTKTLQALKDIRAYAVAEILNTAILVFPNSEVPEDRDKRDEMIDDLNEESESLLNGLDEEFFKYPDDLLSLNYEYVIANKSEFK